MVQSRVCNHIVVVDQGESGVAARGAFDRDRRSSLKGGTWHILTRPCIIFKKNLILAVDQKSYNS